MFYTVFFIACNIEGYRNISKPSCRTVAFTAVKFFKKDEKGSGTSLPASLHDF